MRAGSPPFVAVMAFGYELHNRLSAARADERKAAAKTAEEK